MKLGDKVKHLRKINKVTQSQLASVLKISPSTASAWELGTNSPLMDNVAQMSSYFNVPTSYFFDNVDMTSVNMARLPVLGLTWILDNVRRYHMQSYVLVL